MSKSILVIDTPEKCSMCKLLERTEEGYCYCRGLDFDYQVNEYMSSTPKGKPDWCPLEEIKMKHPTAYNMDKMIQKMGTYKSQQSENEMLSDNGKWLVKRIIEECIKIVKSCGVENKS